MGRLNIATRRPGLTSMARKPTTSSMDIPKRALIGTFLGILKSIAGVTWAARLPTLAI